MVTLKRSFHRLGSFCFSYPVNPVRFVLWAVPSLHSTKTLFFWFPDSPTQSGFRDDVFWQARRLALLDFGLFQGLKLLKSLNTFKSSTDFWLLTLFSMPIFTPTLILALKGEEFI